MIAESVAQFWTTVGTLAAMAEAQRINSHERWQRRRADAITPFLLLGWVPTRRMQSRGSSKPTDWRKPILRWAP